jgi:hypothetical protein
VSDREDPLLTAIAIGAVFRLPEYGRLPSARTVMGEAGGGAGFAARIEKSGDDGEAVGSLHALAIAARVKTVTRRASGGLIIGEFLSWKADIQVLTAAAGIFPERQSHGGKPGSDSV